MNIRHFLLAVVACAIPLAAVAGSPHFVTLSVTQDGNTVLVTGKIAGLGDETQVHIEVSGTAACINPGGNDPKAANKETFSAAGDFPVQNGKALFSLELEATFQPDCLPPMSLVWSDIIVADVEHGLTFGPINF
jgi:hypothetical protein